VGKSPPFWLHNSQKINNEVVLYNLAVRSQVVMLNPENEKGDSMGTEVMVYRRFGR
jgi:hypothetical protein